MHLRHRAVDAPPGAHFAPVQNELLRHRRQDVFCWATHFLPSVDGVFLTTFIASVYSVNTEYTVHSAPCQALSPVLFLDFLAPRSAAPLMVALSEGPRNGVPAHDPQQSRHHLLADSPAHVALGLRGRRGGLARRGLRHLRR